MSIKLQLIPLFSVLLISSMTLSAQVQTNEPSPYIEITGKSEMEIAPDEIFIQVTIKERTKGNKKISIEEQETKMLAGLKARDLSKENISVNDAELGYIRVSIFKKDVIATKEYLIKTSNATEVKSVFEVLDEANIKSAYISKVSHSKIKEFEKELRIKAIQDAKDKAGYLLAAIGNTLGKPVEIREGDNVNVRGSRLSASDYYIDGVRVGNSKKMKEQAKSEIHYQKIKLKADVYVKFLIE